MSHSDNAKVQRFLITTNFFCTFFEFFYSFPFILDFQVITIAFVFFPLRIHKFTRALFATFSSRNLNCYCAILIYSAPLHYQIYSIMIAKFIHAATKFFATHALRLLATAALVALALHWREGGVIPLSLAVLLWTA